VEAVRKWNEPDLSRYEEAVASRDLSMVQGGEVLDKEQIAIEKIMLALRTSGGVSEQYLSANCPASELEDAFASGNLIRTEDGRIRIPEERFFVSDSIISSIL
jgi:coproporphyrinogen III oxidase-like Fe-S oxidoreductase